MLETDSRGLNCVTKDHCSANIALYLDDNLVYDVIERLQRLLNNTQSDGLCIEINFFKMTSISSESRVLYSQRCDFIANNTLRT